MRVLRFGWRLVGPAILACAFATAPSPVFGDEDPPSAPRVPDPGALLRRAERLETRADAAWAEGDAAAASALALEALRLQGVARGPTDPSLLPALERWGGRLAAAGQYAPAEDLLARALAIRQATPDSPPRALAGAAFGLARVRQATGHHAAAEALYRRALALVEKAGGPDHPDVAVTLQALAQIRILLGNHGAAQRLLERALAINERALPSDHPNTAAALSDLAAVLGHQGREETARRYLERALALAEKRSGPESPALVPFLDNLAWGLADEGRRDEARALLDRALAIASKQFGDLHPDTGAVLESLAKWQLREGRPAEARALHERVLRIYEASLGPDHPATAGALRDLALARATPGDPRGAIPLLERSVSILREALGPDHPRTGHATQDLADAHAVAGDVQKALPLHREALAVLSRWVRGAAATLAADRRRELLGTVRGALDRWVAFCPRAGLTGYEEVLAMKGIVAQGETAQRESLRRGGDAARADLEDLAAAERRLAAVLARRPSRRDAERTARWQADYAVAAADLEALGRRVDEKHESLRVVREGAGPAPADLQRSLGQAEGFVDILRAGPAYVAFVLRADGPPERVDLGPAPAVEEAVARWLAAIRTADEEGSGAREAAGLALRDLVWTPLARRLGEGVRAVRISPDAALAAVPFQAMPSATGGRSVGDDVRISYVASAADLLPRRGAAPRGKGSLVVGDVDFDAQAPTPEAPSPAAGSPAAEDPDRTPRRARFAPLPGTADEAVAVVARLGDGTAVLRGAEASEANVRERVRGRARIHVATHGFARQPEEVAAALAPARGRDRWLGGDLERHLAAPDPMMLAGIALAGANVRGGDEEDDGVLSALEASWLDLDGADLVVLSACDTGVGAAVSGEGVLGLAAGFRMAGASHVVASLWRVDDEATRLLMERFYALLLDPREPRSPSDALRGASLGLRDWTDPEGRRPYASPVYWAAFVCYERR